MPLEQESKACPRSETDFHVCLLVQNYYTWSCLSYKENGRVTSLAGLIALQNKTGVLTARRTRSLAAVRRSAVPAVHGSPLSTFLSWVCFRDTVFRSHLPHLSALRCCPWPFSWCALSPIHKAPRAWLFSVGVPDSLRRRRGPLPAGPVGTASLLQAFVHPPLGPTCSTRPVCMFESSSRSGRKAPPSGRAPLSLPLLVGPLALPLASPSERLAPCVTT